MVMIQTGLIRFNNVSASFHRIIMHKRKRLLTNERTLGIISDIIQTSYFFVKRAKSMEKSNTREEILETALELFAVNGYDAL